MRRVGSKQTTGPIGIDVGSRCIKIVQLLHAPDGPAQVIAQIRRVPPHLQNGDPGRWEGLATIVDQMLATGCFEGRHVASCMPNGLLEYRNIRVTPMPPGELASAVHWQFGNHLKLQSDEFKSQFIDAGQVWEGDASRREIVAMAARLDDLNEHLNLLKKCGLTAVAIDAVPGALGRIIPSGDVQQPSRFVLDVGYGSTTLVITHENELRLVRRFDMGIAKIDELAARKLQVNAEEAEQMREGLHGGAASADEGAVWPLGST